jgi:hypothetical protein
MGSVELRNNVDELKSDWEDVTCRKKNFRSIKYEVKELKKQPPEPPAVQSRYVILEPSELADLGEEVGQLQVRQEQFGGEGDRISLGQRSLRCDKYRQKKMKEAQEERELRHELENLKQVLCAIADARGREQSLEKQVAQPREDVAEQGKEAVTEKTTEEN